MYSDRSHNESSDTHPWTWEGFLSRGVGPQVPGMHPDRQGVTVSGMSRVQEFVQVQPWIRGSTQW